MKETQSRERKRQKDRDTEVTGKKERVTEGKTKRDKTRDGGKPSGTRESRGEKNKRKRERETENQSDRQTEWQRDRGTERQGKKRKMAGKRRRKQGSGEESWKRAREPPKGTWPSERSLSQGHKAQERTRSKPLERNSRISDPAPPKKK